MKKGARLLLFTGALGIIDAIYLLYNIITIQGSISNEWESLGYAIGMRLVAPFIICFLAAVVMIVMAYVKWKKSFAVIAGCLFIATLFFNATNIYGMLIEAGLCFLSAYMME